MLSQSQSQQLSCLANDQDGRSWSDRLRAGDGLELMVIRVAGIESLTRSSFLWLLFPSRPNSHCTIPSYASQRYPCHTLHARSYKKGTDTQRKRKKRGGNYDDRGQSFAIYWWSFAVLQELCGWEIPTCIFVHDQMKLSSWDLSSKYFDKAKYFSSPQNIC